MVEAHREQRVLLSITNLKKYFPIKNAKLFSKDKLFVRANEDISIDIYQGETFGLVGESGCGKSTLGHVLLQLQRQTEGRTMYYGREIADIAPFYVRDTLKRLSWYIANRDTLQKAYETQKQHYDALTDETQKWALQDKVTKARKAAEAAHTDIVKIIGGFIVLSDVSEVSALLLQEQENAVRVSRCREKIARLQARVNDLKAESGAGAEKARATEQKIAAMREELSVYQQNLERTREQVNALRKKHASLPGFAENEALRDSGIDLARLKPTEMRILRRDMQLIFQDPYSSLNPRMTVAQLIGEGLLAHDFFHTNGPKMQEYILRVMENCGLAPYMMHRYPHQFSGGQRQRIGIARSLALQPKFVVCDEAVSALDVSIQSQVLNLLMDLKEKENLTYLFISHDLSVIKYISDRVGVMYMGHIVELAASEVLFEKPLHPYTEALMGAIPTTDPDASRELALIKGDIPSAVKPPKGCKFHTRCPHAMDICKQVQPELIEYQPKHFVACHLRTEAKA